jgi:Fe-coproporphyrin III synthase
MGVIRLPLATLYLSERCNSRCVTCDYWRHGREDMNIRLVRRLLPSLRRLGTQVVLLSGGEPLLNPEWAQIAALLRDAGLYPWLLTSGLSLAKHAKSAAELFQAITVSLDGDDRSSYAAIRGLDAFDTVCAGIGAAAERHANVGIRVTVQRANFGRLRPLVELARRLGARQISFLAVDVANPHAFGRTAAAGSSPALTEQQLPLLEQELALLERQHAADFASGFIAESPAKLRRMLQYFAALQGRRHFPAVRCNAPEFSAVITPRGTVQPCFFIAAPAGATVGTADTRQEDLGAVLNGEPMVSLRSAIRAGARRECTSCVCSIWRDPHQLDASLRFRA